MSRVVLDASALLSLVYEEPGSNAVVEIILDGDALVSAVNLTEVVGKLRDGGWTEDEVDSVLYPLDLTIVPFDSALAYLAGHLRLTTRELGLSLGDRACLATAKAISSPALTADRGWAQLSVGVEIRLLR
ncbi:MAG: PIN domain-containing protein [Chloroflexi bacterium]|nr:PIN domain-containing protein [Chloroflexota bacterium]